jgi:hypothetical protein
MLQTVRKSKTKSSSNSKRHFTVVIGSKEHGLYCSSSPSSAARKAVSKLCGKENGKRVEFCIREITQGSKKKTYGPYLGHIEKLAKPIQLKGRLVERTPVVRLKPKSSAKKGGMRGGGIEDINIILGNCGRLTRIGFWKNGCITLIHGNNKVVLYYNEKTKNLEVRYFKNLNNNVYDCIYFIKLDELTIKDVNKIILYLFGKDEDIRADENRHYNKIKNSNKIKTKCDKLQHTENSNNKIKIISDGDSDSDSVQLINSIINFVGKSNDNTEIINKLQNILQISKKTYDEKLKSAIRLCNSLSLNN